MTVKSKFNVNDTVWYISSNRVKSGEIAGVYMKVDKDNVPSVYYRLFRNGGERNESELFDSKSDLIVSLR